MARAIRGFFALPTGGIPAAGSPHPMSKVGIRWPTTDNMSEAGIATFSTPVGRILHRLPIPIIGLFARREAPGAILPEHTRCDTALRVHIS